MRCGSDGKEGKIAQDLDPTEAAFYTREGSHDLGKDEQEFWQESLIGKEAANPLEPVIVTSLPGALTTPLSYEDKTASGQARRAPR